MRGGGGGIWDLGSVEVHQLEGMASAVRGFGVESAGLTPPVLCGVVFWDGRWMGV